MKIFKKFVSVFLLVAVLVTIAPMVRPTALAAATYNVDAAMSYAAAHWNDGKGECAEFVSRCVKAGGIDISVQAGTGPCYRAICQATGLSMQDLVLDSSGNATYANNSGRLSRGDVVIQYCNTHSIAPHIMICGGYNSAGNATFYAHNAAKNNSTYNLKVNTAYQHTKSCNMGAKVIHLSSLAAPQAAETAQPSLSAKNYNMTVAVGSGSTLRFCSTVSTASSCYLGALPNGAAVYVYGVTTAQYENRIWAKINYNGQIGWVNYAWLSDPGPAVVKPLAPAAPAVKVDGNNVTLTWNSVASASYYDAYIIKEPWSWEAIVAKQTTGSNSALFTGSSNHLADGHYAAFVISRPNDDNIQSGWTEFDVDTSPKYETPDLQVSQSSLPLDVSSCPTGQISYTYSGDTANGYYLSYNLVGSDTVSCQWNEDESILVTAIKPGTAKIELQIIEYKTGTVLDTEPISVTVTGEKESNSGLNNFTQVHPYHDEFDDVRQSAWYYDNVTAAYRLGLMIGSSQNLFNVGGNVTVAEAITMASRIHCIFYTGNEHFVQAGGKWYDIYVDYALSNGIIDHAYDDYDRPVTRWEFAEIFANALPSDALQQMNQIDDNAIPDVSISQDYAWAVYRLYRAGILTGSDPMGNFQPDSTISRTEAAVIVSRMVNVNLRKETSLL